MASAPRRAHALTPEAMERLHRVSTATLTSQLLKRGFRNTFITGLIPFRADLRMVGYAFTLRYVPAREDVGFYVDYDNTTNVQRLAVEAVGPDDVLVIDARNDVRAASFGHIIATRIMRRGAAGLVTDGGLRDSPRFRHLEMPTYFRVPHATTSSVVHHPVDMNVPIGCGGVLVMPGDVMVGDAEGVVVIPAAAAEEVAHAADEQEHTEEYILERIRSGESIRGVYPLDEQHRTEYEAWRRSAAEREDPMTVTGRIRSKIPEVRKRLERLPRAHLAHLPTPLDACRNLSRALGGPAVFIKRDDCTGLAFGGNKTRELEYVLGDALAQGADCIIHGAASQSNQSRQIAAAAAKLGIKAYLTPKRDERSSPIQGNYLLDHLLGAEIHPVDPESVMREAKGRLAQKLRAEGRRPYIVGMGTTRPLVLAAVAYVEAFLEIVDQVPDEGVPDWIYTSSQGSTQAGLLLGARLLGLDTKVVGVSATPPEHESYVQPAGIATLAQEAAGTLGYDTRVTASDIEHTCDYVGEGYGVPTEAGKHMIRLLARYEGILLDPVYTGKAFAALVGDIRRGRLTAGERVVFVHTGGLPLLFSYAQEIASDALSSG